MSISKILNSLEKSWERDDILLKIKNGLSSEEIVNEFLINNELQVKELNSLLKPEDIDLLNQVETLSTCEAKLINKINNFDSVRDKDHNHTTQIINEKRIKKLKCKLCQPQNLCILGQDIDEFEVLSLDRR